MLLLPQPKATLTGFHRWQDSRAVIKGYRGYETPNEQEAISSQYKIYVEAIGKLREHTNGYASHWSDLAHCVQWHIDNEDLQARMNIKKPKAKRVDLRAWLKRNHPEIIAEFNKNAA